MSEPRKLDQWEKIRLYPELEIYTSPGLNKISVSMRSPKILLPPENGEYKVSCFRAFRYGEVRDIIGLYEIMKQAIKAVTDEYYRHLYDAELYAIPESMKDVKLFDTFITVEEKVPK